ncbi:hypothetical protein [Oceanobacillus profundus]|nr:hypothetical protein [Oceanobacillus profundus]
MGRLNTSDLIEQLINRIKFEFDKKYGVEKERINGNMRILPECL